MTKRLSAIIILSLLIVAFMALSVFAAKTADNNVWKYREYITKNSKTKLAGGERLVGYATPTGDGTLGFDGGQAASPGIQVGITTYDLQSNTRMNRQIDWRGTQNMHMIWMKATTMVQTSLDRGTGYEMYDAGLGSFTFEGVGGGCDIHPRSGPGINYSGYVGLDVDTEGKVVIGNHHDDGAGYASTVWYDFDVASCFFSPYKRRVPDSVMKYGISPADIALGDYEIIWPQMEYHVFDGDTVTHVFSEQSTNTIRPSIITYFRRVGSDTLGAWDYPPKVIDTVAVIGQSVTASRTSGKVALVWQAPPGAYPGDPESNVRNWVDPGLGVNQRINDIYYMTSTNMGASWSAKTNMTAYDSTKGGFLGHGDMSVLIDTDDILHILWPARIIDPTGVEGGLGTYTYFWGSRMLHWDETNNEIRTVKDANWDIADEDINDSTCTGGAWNEMSLGKPMLSECDGKFYAVFVQFLDLDHGIYNDCARLRWEGAGYRGTANGELYISVSDNGGYNWDVARNLTNTPTPLCDTGVAAILPCESDHYPSVSRFGMLNGSADFDVVPVVDPSGGGYAGDYFLDVLYINDKFPGSCMQDAGIWSTNFVKWFRVPCVDPVPNPVLTYSPKEISQPTWVKPGESLTKAGKLENVGNAPLTVNSVTTIEVNGTAGWLNVSASGSFQISHLSPNYYNFDIYLNAGGAITVGPVVVTGYVVISSNSLGGSTDSIKVELIVADTVQFPEVIDIQTDCKRLAFNNAGNFGNGGAGGNGGYNMNFFNDCDTTNNVSGADDHAKVYLYDGSPFLCYIDAGDTIFNYYMFDASWLTSDGFRPTVGAFADSTTYPDYQYGYSGKYLSKDSNIVMESEYFAPSNPDSCSFIVLKQRFVNNSVKTYNNVFFGDAVDWDIPSDSGSENGSDFDAARNLMYFYGAEYDADSIVNNDCILADQRFGGLSFYAGFKLPHYSETTDRYMVPRAMWSEMNADFVYPTGGFVAQEMYDMMTTTTGYSVWTSTDETMEDSLYQDLHMVSVFTQRTFAPNDTLVFVKILSTSNTGEAKLLGNIDKARAWIAARPDIFTWPEVTAPPCCCNLPGDANNNGAVNILDVTYTIGYLYKGGNPPPCPAEADANGNCTINILDVTYTIGYLYKGGAAPKCPAFSCNLCIGI